MTKKKIDRSLSVQHSNIFNGYSLAEFTPNENKILHAILSKAKNKEDDVIVFGFDDIKELSNIKRNTDQNQFVAYLDNTNTKLNSIFSKYEDEDGILQVNMFSYFYINKKSSKLEVKVNSDFTYLFNQLREQYTSYPLLDFTQLSNKYSLLLYPLLMQWKRVGKYHVDSDEFRRVMGIGESWSTTDIDKRAINPSIKEINEKFPEMNLSVEKERGRKNKVTAYVFRFNPVMSKSDSDAVAIAASDAVDKLRSRHDTTVGKVCKFFNVSEDTLTKSDIRMINDWYEIFEMNDELIKAAISYADEKASIRYVNAILKAWSAKQYRKVSDVPELKSGYISKEDDLMYSEMDKVPEFE